jgi:hypothetical protein
MYVHKPFQLTAFGGKEPDKCRMFEETHAKQGSATDTATDHAIRSTATEHAFSASDIKDARLQNMFREACSDAPSQVQRLLQKVGALGHYPTRYKKPVDKAQKTSDSLAKKLAEAKKLFTPAVQKYLDAMQAVSTEAAAVSTEAKHAQHAEALMQQVRKLGHLPQESQSQP